MWSDEACTVAPIITGNMENDRPLRGVVMPAGEFRKRFDARPPLNLGNLLQEIRANQIPNGPIYLTLARLWAERFGNNMLWLRTLSAILGVMTLPLVFWLCMELFRRSSIAWAVTTLFAVSPIQVEYANEARSYTLMCLVMVLGTALLSRACSSDKKLSWIIYALCQVLCFYIHISTIAVTGLHGLAVLIGARNRFKSFLLSMLIVVAGGVLLLIYLGPYAGQHREVLEHAWWSRSLTFDVLLDKWRTVLALGFSDLNSEGTVASTRFLRESILIGIASAFVFCARRFRGLTRALILIVPIGFLAFLWSLDLVLGGLRASVPRYLFPCFLWTQVAVGAMLASGLDAKKTFVRVGAVTVFLCLCGVALVSDFRFMTATEWWTKWRFQETEELRYIRTLDKPLLAFRYAAHAVLYSTIVEPDVPIYLDAGFKSPPEGYTIVMPRSDYRWLTAVLGPKGFTVKKHPTIANLCTLTKDAGK